MTLIIITKLKNFFNIKNKRQKIIVILGPTTTGKSSIAVDVAEIFNGEIISADSRQIYKGLNIGSGKITNEEMKDIPHHMLDVLSPKERFTAFQFKKSAENHIQKIHGKNKIPIICGGTGFYIDSLVENVKFSGVGPNDELRKKLSKYSTSELFKELKKLDQRRAEKIDNKNRTRIIRSIEIAKSLGKVPKLKKKRKYNILFIGLDLPKEILKEKIYERLMERINSGMIKEVKKLIQGGISFERLYELGLEYRYVSMYIQKLLNKDEMLERLFLEICKYAKRQRTWFKRNKKIKWFDTRIDRRKIFRIIRKFL